MDKVLGDYFLELKSKLNWSDEEMCDRLAVSTREWHKISTGKRDPSLLSVTKFADSIDADISHILKKKIDIPLLAKRLSPNGADAIPERYSVGCFSRMRTSQSLLDFIEFNFGWRQRQRLMRELSMSELSVLDPDRLINMNFVTDICDSMSQAGYTEKVIHDMGRFSVFSNRDGVVGKMFSNCRDPKEVYERLVPILGFFFEKNHSYRILSLSGDHCTIEAKVSEQLQDELKTKKVGSLATCHVRRGVAGSFALYASDVKTRVTETQCIHRGDRVCVYHVEWDMEEQAQLINQLV